MSVLNYTEKAMDCIFIAGIYDVEDVMVEWWIYKLLSN